MAAIPKVELEHRRTVRWTLAIMAMPRPIMAYILWGVCSSARSRSAVASAVRPLMISATLLPRRAPARPATQTVGR